MWFLSSVLPPHVGRFLGGILLVFLRAESEEWMLGCHSIFILARVDVPQSSGGLSRVFLFVFGLPAPPFRSAARRG